MRRAALILGGSAFAVNMPRLVLAYLGADWLVVPTQFTAFLLTLTAIGTAIVLTGGGLFIIHTLAGGRYPLTTRTLLLAVWFLLLAAMAILLTPALLSSIRKQSLPQVLGEWQLLWSAVAIVAPEVLAAGIMLAWVLTEKPAERHRPGRLGRLLDAGLDKALTLLEVPKTSSSPFVTVEGQPATVPPPHQSAIIEQLLEIWRADPKVSQAEAARRVERAAQTVHAHLKTLEAQGRIRRNGKEIHVL